MKIGESIKVLRNKSGISQIKLAQDVGITQTFLSNIERGKKSPRIDLVEKIARALQLPTSALLLHATKEDDVAPNKQDHFQILHRSIQGFIESLLEEEEEKIKI